jgi:hypothetical protein
VIKSLNLESFKAFERFRISFGGDAFLVGPNNAGKSTVIAALRSVANMVRIATREQARDSSLVDGFRQTGYWFGSNSIGLIDENLRHEFHPVETRIKIKFGTGAQLEAVWPEDEDGSGFFFVLDRNGVNITTLRPLREALPTTGIVPVLSPLEHTEELLSEQYVKQNLESRLASRHFRNQLYLLEQEGSESHSDRFAEFKSFAIRWLSEIELTSLHLRRGEGRTSFDLNYRETGSRIEKEIFWAGDGLQIWLQILLHLFRLRGRDVVVLDEPDVFLHPDLQRGLVGLLEATKAQTITATHSTEVISEASDEAVVWVSRQRRSAIRAPSRDLLFELSSTLGTQFNLRLAKALKTKAVVFVEGQDAKVLRSLAKTLGHSSVDQEAGITLLPLGGFDRWKQVEPFEWLVDKFLERSVVTYVLLDRDFMGDEAVESIRRRLKKIGVVPHIWRRKEIENYLLNAACIARQSKAPVDWVEANLDLCAADLEGEVYAEIHSEESSRLRRSGKSPKTISLEAKRRADTQWADVPGRLKLCGGKDLLREMNKALQQAGFQTVTDRGLAAKLRGSEIPQEVKSLLATIEDSA